MKEQSKAERKTEDASVFDELSEQLEIGSNQYAKVVLENAKLVEALQTISNMLDEKQKRGRRLSSLESEILITAEQSLTQSK